MRGTCRFAVGVAFAVTLVSLLAVSAVAQRQTESTATARPRVSNARPDLQGVWNYASVTPLERPRNLADKEVLTDEERAAIERQSVASRVDRTPRPGDVGFYNMVWMEWGTKTVGTRRTSLLVDPPDGRMPPLTPEAKARLAALTPRATSFANPEDAWPWERCLAGFNGGPPYNGTEYGTFVQIVQTPDYVVLTHEMVHDARIIPMSGAKKPSSQIREWHGISTGRWDGDTLVIETTNFRHDPTGVLYLQERNLGITDENLNLVERLRLLEADTLLYEYTVTDPTVWTRPWTVQMTMQKSAQSIYEYACHEGNYALKNSLTGARAEEGRAAAPVNSNVR